VVAVADYTHFSKLLYSSDTFVKTGITTSYLEGNTGTWGEKNICVWDVMVMVII
jgi:hypothetical protein